MFFTSKSEFLINILQLFLQASTDTITKKDYNVQLANESNFQIQNEIYEVLTALVWSVTTRSTA
jgi:hypothetical protein